MKGIQRTIRRRRQEGKTDYKARLAMLKSRKPRLVIRKTNRYIIAQIVTTELAQDKVIINVNSKDLIESGWSKNLVGSLKGKVAAYLTGKLIASKAKTKVKEAIIDIGMQRNVSKSRLYAVVKGAIDGGLNIPCGESVLPTLEELKSNEKTADLLNKVKIN
jgi:large subunit ribosomal protein L18